MQHSELRRGNYVDTGKTVEQVSQIKLQTEPAVAFWPLIDPDIPEHPYCRRCLDKAKIEVLIKIFCF